MGRSSLGSGSAAVFVAPAALSADVDAGRLRDGADAGGGRNRNRLPGVFVLQHNLNTLGFGTLGWEITSSSGGKIQFRHRNGKRYDAGGTMTIAADGSQTLVSIDTRG